MDNIEIVRSEAYKLLDGEKSGHGSSHINRVAAIARKIAEGEESNKELVEAIALLHDVDDYKLFGKESEENLTNTNMILSMTTYTQEEKELIKDALKTIGYSKRLANIIPKSIEAKIVSDADMLDAIGAIGLLRSIEYNISHNNQLFDRNRFPILDMDAETYKLLDDNTCINHVFEKMLKLKDLMLTETGKKEALKRHNFLIEFLKEFFYEQNEDEWLEYLDNYIKKLKK